MSCAAKKKHIAVCIDASAKPTWAQYRFGPLATILTTPELVMPAETAAGFKPFSFARTDLISGSVATLTFSSGDIRYEVFTQDGRDGGGGVVVNKGSKVMATVSCTGEVDEHWELLEPHLATTPRPKPEPVASLGMQEVCNDEALLLLKYGWDDLRGDLFKKVCCVKGALGKDDGRCEDFDWPSSDMPECDYFDTIRNDIFARYGFIFKEAKWLKRYSEQAWYTPRADFDASWMPAIANKNVASLKKLACPKTASSSSCDAAANRWTLDLKGANKGKIDEVQQRLIAAELAKQCKDGWSEEVAGCYAAGKNTACNLRFTQMGNATEAVQKISPGVVLQPE